MSVRKNPRLRGQAFRPLALRNSRRAECRAWRQEQCQRAVPARCRHLPRCGADQHQGRPWLRAEDRSRRDGQTVPTCDRRNGFQSKSCTVRGLQSPAQHGRQFPWWCVGSWPASFRSPLLRSDFHQRLPERAEQSCRLLIGSERDANAALTTVVARPVAHQDAACAHRLDERRLQWTETCQHEISLTRPVPNSPSRELLLEFFASLANLADVLDNVVLVSQGRG